MSTMKAIKHEPKGSISLVEVPIPEVKEGQYLVKTVAAAHNPVDNAIIDYGLAGGPGSSVGFDFSGIIEKAGPGTSGRFSPGDRVAGIVHGCNTHTPTEGAYQEYIPAEEHMMWKIPKNVDLVQASALGAAAVTAALSLYHGLKVPVPGEGVVEEGTWFLVYGGSSSVSQSVIQLAKLAGFRVVTTASKRNHELVKGLGAEYVFEYGDVEECIKNIKAVVGDDLRYAHDSISEGESTRIVLECMSSKGGKVVSTIPVPEEKAARKDVEMLNVDAFSAAGRSYSFMGHDYPAVPSARALTGKFAQILEGLIAQGKFKLQGIRVIPGGLAGVKDGFEEIKGGRASQLKLVYVL
ncbi:GroES-like protein [Choiromyces venosus 120613-1]|uniref:GroES-like protein n=1 Tax=Choiromyces venosus 120613-1 TaxID=1336337 RepID=A0A3N4JL13_9PEZI|nr:GroES-like protein [Choiromyces venosus 120613-1]